MNHVTTGLCQQRHCRSTYQQPHYCSTSHVTTALLTMSLPFYHQCNYCCVNHITTGLCQQRHCRSTYQQLHYVSTSHATTAILIWSPKILSTMSLLLFQPHHCSVKNVTNDLPMRSLSTNQPRHYHTFNYIATNECINYITTNECIKYITTNECSNYITTDVSNTSLPVYQLHHYQ